MDILLFLLYHIVRGVFITLRRLYWKINGVSSFLAEINRGRHYNKSAQVGTIIWRGKIIEHNLADEADFLFVHERFAHPRCVLDNDVTLYTITDNNEAIFVETPSNINIYSSDVHPFFYAAQFKHAVRVIKLPFESFTILANEIGDPKMKIVLISNTGRCGSTLLLQIFESTGQFITISEPDAMTKLALLRMKSGRTPMEEKTWCQMYKNLVRLQCKPRAGVDIQPAYCIKTRHVCVNDIEVLMAEFPDVHQIFLYRNILNTTKSMHSITNSYNKIQQYYLPINKVSNTMVNALLPNWAKGKKFTKSPLSCYILEWGLVMSIYLHHQQNGVRVAAIRYEDILDSPTEACSTIFKYCNISTEFVSSGVKALCKESQRGSAIMRTDKAAKRMEITVHMKKELNEILSKMGLPKLDEPCIVSGLITGHGQL
ncbi:unnamed protein product [Owenia fusiformis]|uniref:Sulfotransferase n=1 Tax=Owenia fusiformis TaxID=6347 RepID=A0A8S4Q5A1_OWEFU|nr:unnamed protein product [Owenia fusiformis]